MTFLVDICMKFNNSEYQKLLVQISILLVSVQINFYKIIISLKICSKKERLFTFEKISRWACGKWIFQHMNFKI